MLAIGGNAASTGYNLTRSLRLRSSASANLSRTPSSTGNQQKMTLSFWVKRGTLSTYNDFLNCGSTTANFFYTGFGAADGIALQCYTGSTQVANMSTTAVFRDPAAWYHIVYSIDTTQASSANGLRLYVNGVQQTVTISYYVQNANLYINTSGVIQYFGRASLAANEYLDGYLTEVNFIDGQALTPSSFGSTNTLTGVWQPARYTGTYGTNGFYLPFTDNSALTTSSNVGLGKDFSGNGNYWTTNNISITAGVTYDSMTDVPTLTNATTANYCVLNPLSNGAGTLSGGNLNHVVGGSITRCNSTIFASSGKWYFEVTLNTAGTNTSIGIGQNNITNQYPGQDSLSFVQEIDNARKGNNDVYTSYGTALTAGQVFMCAVDLDNLKIFFGGQGTWFASSNPVTGASPAFTLTAGLYCAISRPFGGSAAISINFGQRPFAYTPPTGFVALNTFNLPTSTIVKGNTVMDATLYTGNGSTQTITNAAGFRPDLVWYKGRSTAYNNSLFDSVRGATKQLISNTTDAEATLSGVTAFNSNGFSLGSDANGNNNGTTYVGWQWQAGQGSSSSNTNGTITSTVSVNASAGFSVVTYTGNNINPSTVGHGLGVAPSLIIFKPRNTATYNWNSYHISLGNTQFISLNTDSAASSSVSLWNNTSPTSTVFTINNIAVNTSATTYVAYCWTPIAGYSAFGSYTGNGSTDGPFVYLGFRPKWVMIKRYDVGAPWVIFDSSRNTYNVVNNYLVANTSDAEGSGSSPNDIDDFLSNGFKIRCSNAGQNASGGGFIYMAYAENPFRNALAR